MSRKSYSYFVFKITDKGTVEGNPLRVIFTWVKTNLEQTLSVCELRNRSLDYLKVFYELESKIESIDNVDEPDLGRNYKKECEESD
jgi:hypothetical protein